MKSQFKFNCKKYWAGIYTNIFKIYTEMFVFITKDVHNFLGSNLPTTV